MRTWPRWPAASCPAIRCRAIRRRDLQRLGDAICEQPDHAQCRCHRWRRHLYRRQRFGPPGMLSLSDAEVLGNQPDNCDGCQFSSGLLRLRPRVRADDRPRLARRPPDDGLRRGGCRLTAGRADPCRSGQAALIRHSGRPASRCASAASIRSNRSAGRGPTARGDIGGHDDADHGAGHIARGEVVRLASGAVGQRRGDHVHGAGELIDCPCPHFGNRHGQLDGLRSLASSAGSDRSSISRWPRASRRSGRDRRAAPPGPPA